MPRAMEMSIKPGELDMQRLVYLYTDLYLWVHSPLQMFRYHRYAKRERGKYFNW